MPLAKKRQTGSRTTIDVLIPAIEKDLRTLPHVIDGVRRHVKHPIGQIIVVAPPSSKIRQLCARKKCRFVNENRVLPITKSAIGKRIGQRKRAGWIFQQLLKLSGTSLCRHRFYLVIDADTVLIRPHLFRQNQQTIFYCRSWSRKEYFNTYRRLMKSKATSPRSFVTHYMLFDKAKLAHLKRTIAAKHNMPWYSAILKSINKSKSITFSEFETYGNFLYSRYRSQMVHRSALNKSFPGSYTQFSRPAIQKLAVKYRSLSFHKRKIYRKNQR